MVRYGYRQINQLKSDKASLYFYCPVQEVGENLFVDDKLLSSGNVSQAFSVREAPKIKLNNILLF